MTPGGGRTGGEVPVRRVLPYPEGPTIEALVKTSRLLAPVLVLLLVGGLLAVAGDVPAPRPQGPGTLDELDERLTATTERMEKLLFLAGRDPRFKLVEAYRLYTIEDFGKRRRDVEADDLLDILTDDEAPMPLRQAAYDALTWQDAMRFDPDLKTKPGEKDNPRADFARLKVTKFLTNRDKYTRKFAHDLLCAWFNSHRSDPEVVTYDALNGSKSQWGKAKAHWNKVLRR